MQRATSDPAPEHDTAGTPDAAALPAGWQRLLQLDPAPNAIAHGKAAAAGSSGALGFFLELSQDELGHARLEAAPVWLARASRERPARAYPLDARRLGHTRLSATEQRLAAGVLGLPQSQRKGRNYAHLASHLGNSLLIEMLDIAPCFLGGIAGLQLTRGKLRPLKWRWETLRDGRQRPRPDLPASQRVVRVDGLWYLDIENAELGPLADSAADLALLDAAPLEPIEAAALAASLPGSPLGARLAAPAVFAPARRAEYTPQPVLTLNALTRHARLAAGTPPLAFARLAFDYGGERLPSRGGETMVRRVRNGRLLEIARHRAEELAVMERLESAGLVPAVDCEGLPWDLAETLPDDTWLFPGTGHTGALEVNTPARWLALRARLEPEGFAIDYASSFPFEVLEEAPRWYVAAETDRKQASFGLQIGIDIDGQRVDLLPAVAQALREQQWTLTRGANETDNAVWYAPVDERRRVPVALATLRSLLAPIADYLELAGNGVLHLPRVQAGRLEEIADAMPADGVLDAPDKLKSLATRLREAATTVSDAVPAAFVGTLRPYQREGLRWLNALASAGLGGILADDMGLGKTVQVLAHLLTLQQDGALVHPALVVVPTSLLPNWEAEIARYAPGLTRITVHGPQRSAALAVLDQHHIVLTSYALLPRDAKELKRRRFSVLVLDEAQQVKNPRTQARRAAAQLKAPRCLCLTGTPLENHLGELWSQIDLAVPGLLGDERGFRQHYRVPIEKHGDEGCQARLNRRIAPFILRRSKSEVAKELPPKTEITRTVALEGQQRALYHHLRESLAEELREVIAARGIEHSGIVVLDALLKLRQVCCDPRLVKLESARAVRESAKFELLMEMLPELIAEGRRVLLFSQFTEMLGLVARELDRRRIDYVVLTGETRDRAEPVRRFQDGEVPLFLLSLKAGGVGLNLTAADTVIHYDPWWNPAAEAQASDRAHRIGQDKPVFVYRLICAGTVEQRIEALKARKAELADAILQGGGSRDRLSFTQEDLDSLFATE
ncbi:MAG TPA: DEAD/DEAH box helicase [Rhodanobacteraceae bacterium]|nr:DEAD/DEAH box helicase [Rhodanobacteraceae bacterium]